MYTKLIKYSTCQPPLAYQKSEFRFLDCYNLSYIQVCVVAPIVCGGRGVWFCVCSVIIGALSSLALALLRTIEHIALL